MVGLQTLALHGVAAHHLALEIIVAHGIIRIHHWRSGVGLDGILEDAPVGSIAIDDAWGNIGRQRQQPIFRGVHQGCTCAIFFTSTTQVDAIGLSVIGTDTIIALVVATAQRQGMLLGKASARGLIKPVDVSSQIHTCVAPAKANVTILLCIHHLQLLVDEVPR